eukprot:52432-Chlamydomonas_euryale.AAC.2
MAVASQEGVRRAHATRPGGLFKGPLFPPVLQGRGRITHLEVLRKHVKGPFFPSVLHGGESHTSRSSERMCCLHHGGIEDLNRYLQPPEQVAAALLTA